ncbi:uncharacterized protein LOC107030146 [Solanum pennellii]|uniref:Uncharacterized protein LOC107030146 n=1 Tax=Solanum pennellii TaxID=28526 RepID=A0ABM1HL01_SOLPN|nr:uncharacterized protein LOC107030146 [Solanum pennellii]
MNTRRTPDRRVEKNDVHEEIPPQVEQVPQGDQVPPQGDQVPIVEGGNDVPIVPPELSIRDIREALFSVAQAVTTQTNLSMVPMMNVIETTMTSRLRDFRYYMNTQRSAGRRVDEEFANSGIPPRGNQLPPLDEISNDDQDQVNPPLFTDAEIRANVLQLAQDITTQAQAVTTKAQAITAQANREVGDESRLRKRNREVKEAKSFESGSPKSRLDVQDNPKFKKRVINPKPQEGRNVDPPRERLTRGKCGKKHGGECLVRTNSCYGCGKVGHIVKDCPNARIQGKDKALPSGPNSEAPKRNRFYAPKARGEQESSPNIVTGRLHVFAINVYALLDTGATLSLITPLVSKKFDVLLDVLIKPFSV